MNLQYGFNSVASGLVDWESQQTWGAADRLYVAVMDAFLMCKTVLLHCLDHCGDPNTVDVHGDPSRANDESVQQQLLRLFPTAEYRHYARFVVEAAALGTALRRGHEAGTLGRIEVDSTFPHNDLYETCPQLKPVDA